MSADSPSEPTPPRAWGVVLRSGAWAGLLGGAAAGAIDGLWSFGPASQFAPRLLSRLGFALHLAGGYALLFGLVACLVAAVVNGYLRWTRLGDLLRSAKTAHAEARASGGHRAVAGVSILVATIPCLTFALGATYLGLYPWLATRKHVGLVIAVAMGATVVALIVGIVVGIALGAAVEKGLAALLRGRRLATALSSLWALPATFLLLALVMGALAAHRTWSTLSLLPLRGPAIAALATVLCAGAIGSALRLATWRSGWRGGAAVASALVLSLLLFLTTGRSQAVLKTSASYSGLGSLIARALRAAIDLDSDGYSAVLGGGDCDDFDRLVHPGAREIPDDGIDQNCVGGDVSEAARFEDLSYSTVPGSVPADLNVVLITIDTLRADHVGSYGYKQDTTPNLDRLAAEGALFENAWAHAPSTRYSMPAILTGRFPLQVRYDTSVSGWPGLSETALTLAEALGAQGLTGGAITNYWYFDEVRRMNQGFASYDNSNKRLHQGVANAGPAHTRGSSSKEQTDKAIEFVRTQKDGRFFLWVHYYDPHYEYERHNEVPTFGDSKRGLYDGEIRYTDLHLGRLLDELRASGVYDRTAIVVTGDHGEGFGEHGVELHGYHLYAAQTKVPLVIRVPGLKPARVTMPAGHVDILPTLANLVGAAPDPEIQGRSLLDVVSGTIAPTTERWIFQQLSYENNNEMRGAANARCHIIYNVSPQSSWELYRVDTDPMETHDIIDNPGDCGGARSILERWYDQSEIPTGASDALAAGPPAAPRLDVGFGSEMTLLDVELPAKPVAPGSSFEITLTFAAHGALRGGYKIFAHFENQKGGRFTADHAPPRPFEWWKNGQTIRYRHTVTVPRGSPKGDYTLWLGLWLKDERRAAVSTIRTVIDDRVDVGTVVVGP